MARVFMLLSVIFISVYVTEQAYFLEEDYINEINEQATTWKAGVNFDPNMAEEHFVKLLGSKGVQIPNKVNHKMYKTEDESYDNLFGRIPRHFDARKRWRHCSTIGRVRDQGNCGSCWALATSSAFADRLCVATNGDFNQLLSAEEITFCCHTCGFGCHGGYPIKAWERFKKHGIVTGGDYKSREGCEPYRVPPCPYDEQGNNTCAGKPMEKNHRCTRMCYGDQEIDFDEDHRFTRDYYYLTYGSIQKDVMTYGPIEASFDVYSDFPSYKSGIYERTENATYLGGHAVKLIGWGEQYGIPYWLMVNSWNEGWGDNGLFKIRRGTNECGVDNSTTAGVPVTNAGVNFDPNMAEEHFVKLLGSKGVQIPNKVNHKMYKTEDESYDNLFGRIPRHFDARKRWRHCSTIGRVRDQGNCGSCWALATSSAFADRLCVATNGDFNQLLSAEEITFCCHTCGFGCHGGYPIKAWERFKKHGIVTGGDYKSREGCEPYRVPPCPYDEQGNNTCAGKPMEKNHRCTRMCYGDQEIDFDEDHRFTRDYYYLTYGSIQKDVMTYGPIEASFDVYSDFPSYKSGIYERTENATYLGGHAVKLIGWGEQYGIPYWLMVNSWNEGWGDNGLFKIRRGTNECGVDNSTTAGVPVTN